MAKCEICNGKGGWFNNERERTEWEDCDYCDGTGKDPDSKYNKEKKVTCPACRGRGYLGSFFHRSPCYTCNETGKITN